MFSRQLQNNTFFPSFVSYTHTARRVLQEIFARKTFEKKSIASRTYECGFDPKQPQRLTVFIALWSHQICISVSANVRDTLSILNSKRGDKMTFSQLIHYRKNHPLDGISWQTWVNCLFKISIYLTPNFFFSFWTKKKLIKESYPFQCNGGNLASI